MDTIQFYAIAAGRSNTPLLIIRFITHMANTHALQHMTPKHALLPMIVRRHRFLGPWTRAQVPSQLITWQRAYSVLVSGRLT